MNKEAKVRLWARQNPGCGKDGEHCLLGLEPDSQQSGCQVDGSLGGRDGAPEEGHIKEERISSQFHSYKTRKKHGIQELGS